jgi:Flp pilus assembly protein TadB
MAKERAARRAEREREAAARAEQRAAEAAQQSRRRARSAARSKVLTTALRPLVPRRRSRPGVLARKRRAQNRVVLGLAAVTQVFGWLAFNSVRTSLLILVLTAFALPVVLTLAFDRRA